MSDKGFKTVIVGYKKVPILKAVPTDKTKSVTDITVLKVYGARFQPYYHMEYKSFSRKFTFDIDEKYPFSPIKIIIRDGSGVVHELDYCPLYCAGSLGCESPSYCDYGWDFCGSDYHLHLLVDKYLEKQSIQDTKLSSIKLKIHKILTDAIEKESKELTTEKETIEMLHLLQKEWIEKKEVSSKQQKEIKKLKKQLRDAEDQYRVHLDFLKKYQYVCPLSVEDVPERYDDF